MKKCGGGTIGKSAIADGVAIHAVLWYNKGWYHWFACTVKWNQSQKLGDSSNMTRYEKKETVLS